MRQVFSFIAFIAGTVLACNYSIASDHDYMSRYMDEEKILNNWLDQIANGKLLRSIIPRDKENILQVPSAVANSNPGDPNVTVAASAAEIAAYSEIARHPEDIHVDPLTNEKVYSCAHFLIPTSAMHVDYFGVSGNDNGTLIGGAYISISYPTTNVSPVVFLPGDTTPHVLRSVSVSAEFEAPVGDNRLDPAGANFVIDRDNCTITSHSDW
jgi:hypothetical protein